MFSSKKRKTHYNEKIKKKQKNKKGALKVTEKKSHFAPPKVPSDSQPYPFNRFFPLQKI